MVVSVVVVTSDGGWIFLNALVLWLSVSWYSVWLSVVFWFWSMVNIEFEILIVCLLLRMLRVVFVF